MIVFYRKSQRINNDTTMLLQLIYDHRKVAECEVMMCNSIAFQYVTNEQEVNDMLSFTVP